MIAPMLALLLAAVPDRGVAWERLADRPVPVECAEVAGKPWCRSYGIIEAPIDAVAAALRDMRYNADLFSSVVRIDVLDEQAIHVVLDYPSPMDDRDYVAHYTYREEGAARIFEWQPVRHPKAPPTDEAVRLPDYAGEWRLEPRGGFTWVRYTWQAEINGSFPSWAYSQAWKRAGYEALRDLANTQKARLRAP